MPNLSLSLQESLQMIVISYLHEGKDIPSIKQNLQILREQHKQQEKIAQVLDCKTLFELTPVNSAENSRFITAILGNLGLSDEEQGAYLATKKPDINLYQLLSDLYNDDPVKYNHLRRLLVEVNLMTKPRNWVLIYSFGAMLSAAIGALFYFRQDYADAIERWARQTMPTVVDWLSRTFSLLKNWPILGATLQGLSLVAIWIRTFASGGPQNESKLSRLFFKTLSSGFSIAAYSTMYLAAGITTPLAAGFFIASSAVGFLKSLYILIFKTRGHSVDPSTLEQKYEPLMANARTINMLHRNRRTLGIQFLATLLTTAAVAAMCILPAGLITFISCWIFMVMVEQVRSIATAKVHDNCDAELQQRIVELTANLEHDERLYPYESKVHNDLLGRRNNLADMESGLLKQSAAVILGKQLLKKQIHTLAESRKTLESEKITLTTRSQQVESAERHINHVIQDAYTDGFSKGFDQGYDKASKQALSSQSLFAPAHKQNIMQSLQKDSAMNDEFHMSAFGSDHGDEVHDDINRPRSNTH